MAFEIDANKTITLPAGDDAEFSFSGLEGLVSLDAGDKALFVVFDKSSNTSIFKRSFDIVDGTAVIRLTNADTRVFAPGAYTWNLRVITDPELDEDGNIICADADDHVRTLFNARMPKFIVTEAGCVV